MTYPDIPAAPTPSEGSVPLMHVGLCQGCMTIQAVWPHPERQLPVPDPNDWESFATACKVCDGTIDWDETVPVTDYLSRGW